MNGETEIIMSVQGIEDDVAVPQISNAPRFLLIHARTMAGPLDVRISVNAFEELKAAFAEYLRTRASR
jgi:hypothetical protein